MNRKSSLTSTKSAVLILIFLSLCFGLKAQEDTYWIGLSFKNPAAIATPSDWIYGVLTNTVDGLTDQSFKLYSGAFDYKISQKAGTIGLDFNYQKYNRETLFFIKANYAYDIQVLETSFLSFGVSVGTTSYKVDFSDYKRYETADPNYIRQADIKTNILNGNAGLFLHSPRLSTGLSLTFERMMNESRGNDIPAVLTGVLAYRIVNNDIWVITPNFLVDYASKKFSSIPGIHLKLKNAWAGYQNLNFEDFHSINLGADVKTKFRIGYSYSFSEFLSIDGLSIHEFVLGYRLQ